MSNPVVRGKPSWGSIFSSDLTGKGENIETVSVGNGSPPEETPAGVRTKLWNRGSLSLVVSGNNNSKPPPPMSEVVQDGMARSQPTRRRSSTEGEGAMEEAADGRPSSAKRTSPMPPPEPSRDVHEQPEAVQPPSSPDSPEPRSSRSFPVNSCNPGKLPSPSEPDQLFSSSSTGPSGEGGQEVGGGDGRGRGGGEGGGGGGGDGEAIDAALTIGERRRRSLVRSGSRGSGGVKSSGETGGVRRRVSPRAMSPRGLSPRALSPRAAREASTVTWAGVGLASAAPAATVVGGGSMPSTSAFANAATDAVKHFLGTGAVGSTESSSSVLKGRDRDGAVSGGEIFPGAAVKAAAALAAAADRGTIGNASKQSSTGGAPSKLVPAQPAERSEGVVDSGELTAVVARESGSAAAVGQKGVDAAVPRSPPRKKKTFIQKMGDMLEAAAENAIPPSPARRRVRPGPVLTWESWDAASLRDFMSEEVRVMDDKGSRKVLAEAGGDKVALIRLAKHWRVPFMSQVDFNRQKVALQNPGMWYVDDSGRCVHRSPTSDATQGSDITSSPPAARRGVKSLLGWGTTGDAAVRWLADPCWISRAAVVGSVVTHGSRNRYYLVEVETLGDAGGTWACFKRYGDFYELWQALSSLHPIVDTFEFPPERWDLSNLSYFGGRGETLRQEKLTALLTVLLDLDPRPPELVRFLLPHLSDGSTPMPIDAASRVVGISSGEPTSSSLRLLGVSTTLGGIVRDGAGRNVLKMMPLPPTPALRLFLAAVFAIQSCAAVHAAGFAPTLACAVGMIWATIATIVVVTMAAGAAARRGCYGGSVAKDNSASGRRAAGALTCSSSRDASPDSWVVVGSSSHGALDSSNNSRSSVSPSAAALVQNTIAAELSISLLLAVFYAWSDGTGAWRGREGTIDLHRAEYDDAPVGVFAFGDGDGGGWQSGGIFFAMLVWFGRVAGSAASVGVTALGYAFLPPLLASIATSYANLNRLRAQHRSAGGDSGNVVASQRTTRKQQQQRQQAGETNTAQNKVGSRVDSAAAAARVTTGGSVRASSDANSSCAVGGHASVQSTPTVTRSESAESAQDGAVVAERLPPGSGGDGLFGTKVTRAPLRRSASQVLSPEHDHLRKPLISPPGLRSASLSAVPPATGSVRVSANGVLGGAAVGCDDSEGALRLVVICGGVLTVLGGAWTAVGPVVLFAMEMLLSFAGWVFRMGFASSQHHGYQQSSRRGAKNKAEQGPESGADDASTESREIVKNNIGRAGSDDTNGSLSAEWRRKIGGAWGAVRAKAGDVRARLTSRATAPTSTTETTTTSNGTPSNADKYGDCSSKGLSKSSPSPNQTKALSSSPSSSSSSACTRAVTDHSPGYSPEKVSPEINSSEAYCPAQGLAVWIRGYGMWSRLERVLGARAAERVASAGRGIDRGFAAVYGDQRSGVEGTRSWLQCPSANVNVRGMPPPCSILCLSRPRGGVPALSVAQSAPFGSTVGVLLTYAVVVTACLTVRREGKAVRRKRWGALVLLLGGKAVVAGFLVLASCGWSALFRLASLRPAVMLCAIETWRCLAGLALTCVTSKQGLGELAIKEALGTGSGAICRRGRSTGAAWQEEWSRSGGNQRGANTPVTPSARRRNSASSGWSSSGQHSVDIGAGANKRTGLRRDESYGNNVNSNFTITGSGSGRMTDLLSSLSASLHGSLSCIGSSTPSGGNGSDSAGGVGTRSSGPVGRNGARANVMGVVDSGSRVWGQEGAAEGKE